ncbi:asparaginase [Dysosmobacter sp. Marseille-Q4140]|nr:asparaginase [Dysosmobacter sp. Marseille-Q4140]
MSEAIVQVTRGSIVESCHRGSVAVTNGRGDLIAYAGNPDFVTYIRSAAKPFQAMNILFSGAWEAFGFTEKELAIMCSSHYGEDFHRETIQGILKKLGLSHQDLLCGAPLSINPAYRDRQLWEHLPIDETNSDCSGKHCGFLAVCRKKGYPIENYTSPQHPMQKELLHIVSTMCSIPEAEIAIGIDGCGVPVHAMPLRNMAMGYARLTAPAQLEEPYRSAAKRITAAMAAYPEMIAGTGGFCTEFLRHTHGRFCGKLGAEAVYCIGAAGQDLGIAVKIEDGNYRALYPAVMSVLIQLKLLDEKERTALQAFSEPDNLNDHGIPVGKIRPCFSLHR